MEFKGFFYSSFKRITCDYKIDYTFVKSIVL